MEPDSDLRLRVQLAPEELPYAGLTGAGYRARALRTAPEIKDVASIKGDGGRVDIVLLAREGDGAVSPEIVAKVNRAFQDDEATQLTDIVTVRSAEIVPYSVELTLKIRRGPDPALVQATADASLRAYAADRHRVGQTVFHRMLEAAASVGGVEEARVDIGDIEPGAGGAAFLESLDIEVEVLG